ncbi:MAG: hypothetical protein U1E15_08980 [Hyphomicrobiales bacterium]
MQTSLVAVADAAALAGLQKALDLNEKGAETARKAAEQEAADYWAANAVVVLKRRSGKPTITMKSLATTGPPDMAYRGKYPTTFIARRRPAFATWTSISTFRRPPTPAGKSATFWEFNIAVDTQVPWALAQPRPTWTASG